MVTGTAMATVTATSARPSPVQLTVLGDSITACFGVGGGDADTCGPKAFFDYLAGAHAPGATYQNSAVSGAVTSDVSGGQINAVPTGAGHQLVLIYAGGNDLQSLLAASDTQAMSQFPGLLSGLEQNWITIFRSLRRRDRVPPTARR